MYDGGLVIIYTSTDSMWNPQQPQSKSMMDETKETKQQSSNLEVFSTLRHIADSQSGYVQSEDIQSKYNHL